MAIKLPPYDLEIEKIVLGSLIANSNSLNEVRTIINEDCFYDLFHKDVFNAIKFTTTLSTSMGLVAANSSSALYNISESSILHPERCITHSISHNIDNLISPTYCKRTLLHRQ